MINIIVGTVLVLLGAIDFCIAVIKASRKDVSVHTEVLVGYICTMLGFISLIYDVI